MFLHLIHLLHHFRHRHIIISSKKNIKKKTYHEKKIQNHQKKIEKFHNVMTKIYFNDYAIFKYDLTFYIYDQNHDIMIFDNSIELRNHVLNYYDVDIRFAKFKYRNRKINYIQHAKKHVYNFFFYFFS